MEFNMPDFIPYTRHQLEYALGMIGKAVYQPLVPLEITAWRTTEPLPFDQRQSGEELHLKIGDKWGGLFDCAWFRFRGQAPLSVAGAPLVLLLDVNGEMCVFDEQGVPVRGLTSVGSGFDYSLGNPGKRVLPLVNPARGGEQVEVWADAGCNDLFGNLQGDGRIQEAAIAVYSEEMRALYYDFEVLLDSLHVIPEKSPRHQQILTALNDAVHHLWGGFTLESVEAARWALSPMLARRGGDPSLQISAIGHAHIDLGWLWPIRETKRKGARTFATALANMERYPDYVFAASQAQLFQWMKECYPVLYEKIRQKVSEGRIEPQGALWVECDTNLTGGEALVRQILYGRQFFRQDFSVDPRYVWLPDTFGYSAALPQIMRLAGIQYFSTQKLSWSLINTFPHHSFHWQGIDGSTIPVHMLPEETYNSPAAPRSIGYIETNYADKGISDHALLVFGIGDGGGGPGEEHLERLVRMKNFAGLSPVRQEWTGVFFEKWIKDSERFATWVGELYLERHQGTLTTNARNKRSNRRMEQALRELEWVAAMAEIETSLPYPTERLGEIWREALLYQFHDILPGSSIKRVYDESLARYQILMNEVELTIHQCQAALGSCVNTLGMRAPLMVFNSLSWEHREWVRLGENWRKVSIPALGYAVFDCAAPGEDFSAPVAETDLLENERLRVCFDRSGGIVSLFDKLNGREVIPSGEVANRLAVFRDPGDAWDFPMDYASSQPRWMELVESRAWVDGPHALLEQVYRLGHSDLVQHLQLSAGSDRLAITSQLRWRERETMLRALFPVAVQADEASYEIQFGHVRRPTHCNTTWDLARDEVAGQKWTDLSQRDYGVALLNDCKYGHRIKGHTLEIDLLRSVPYPGAKVTRDEDYAPGDAHDGYTDQADHIFRYALYAHAGDAVSGGVIQAAYEFNFPLRLLPVDAQEGGLPLQKSFIQVSAPQIVVETVKRCEDGEGWIVRMYESTRAQVMAQISFGFPVKAVQEVNLIEESLQTLEVKVDSIDLDFRPFEIKTLRVRET
jgi:alpha-mannosidase